MAVPIDFNSLYSYWNADALSQANFINKLQTSISMFQQYVESRVALVVQLNQPISPTQAQWEQAWEAQTGNSLPIPPNAILLWYDTSGNTFGGQFGTVSGRSTVYKREPFYPKGATIYFNRSYLSTTISGSTVMLSGNRANMPSLTFTINQDFDLWLKFEASLFMNAVPGGVGVDFELNGDKVGTSHFGLSGNMGLYNFSYGANGRMVFSQVPIFGLSAGTYTVQALLGVIAQKSGASYDAGAEKGIRILTARAIAR